MAELVKSERMSPRGLSGKTSFACIVTEGREALRSLAQTIFSAEGTLLIRQGSPADVVFLIDRGFVKLVHSDVEGRESLIGVRGAGWPLGAASAILQADFPITAITLTACEVGRIPSAVLLRCLKSQPEISFFIHQAHSREIYDQVCRAAGLATGSACNRLLRLLVEIVAAEELDPARPRVRVHLPLKGWEMAQLIAVTPQYLSGMWRELEKEGLIARDKGWLVICDWREFLKLHDW